MDALGRLGVVATYGAGTPHRRAQTIPHAWSPPPTIATPPPPSHPLFATCALGRLGVVATYGAGTPHRRAQTIPRAWSPPTVDTPPPPSHPPFATGTLEPILKVRAPSPHCIHTGMTLCSLRCVLILCPKLMSLMPLQFRLCAPTGSYCVAQHDVPPGTFSSHSRQLSILRLPWMISLSSRCRSLTVKNIMSSSSRHAPCCNILVGTAWLMMSSSKPCVQRSRIRKLSLWRCLALWDG